MGWKTFFERARQQLYRTMYDAFFQHGPPFRGHTWHKGAVEYTMASILKALALAHGERATIKDRIAYHLKPATVEKSRRRRPANRRTPRR